MFNKRALAPLIAFIGWCLAALPCSLTMRPIWSKNPRSSSALFRVVVGGKAGYIDASGRFVIAPRFNPYYVEAGDGDFVEGAALVFVSGHLGFIDETGKLLSSPDLVFNVPFSESVTIATRRSEGGATGHQLLVDRSGHIVTEVNAYWIHPFSDGLAAFAENGLPVKFDPNASYGHLRGYIDLQGKVVIKPQFAFAGPFSQGLAAVALDGSCWVAGWGGSRFPAPSAKVQYTSCGPRAAASVTQPCRHGYIDKTGRFVIPARYELAEEFADGRAAVRANGKWGFIDRNGTEITRSRFDEVRSFSEGKAAVRIADKSGYIDKSGAFVIELEYDDALPFSNGLAAVKKGDHYLYVNALGAEAISGAFLQATPFVLGLAHVQTGPATWAWIEPSGKVIFRYDWQQDF